ncbi:hypothetical protein FIV06_31440 (plasmid) [Labrenzia sp. THAF191b]|uniref:Uncharacterized protein n=2 Tax=Hyphomicrobiales TaxID=356 RepID=A0A5E8H6N9_ROSAD|nr:hypothetical protein [Labrenzia sp. THAF191a]EEE48186.2 hypothetical protein SADFL11_80 [Roseibium alexandrii DFL-11]QFT01991.1 hypothetical protein FIV06_31440 [Labrenzia sp. THAF191b]QFT19852.1 hypothetical protein FIV03_31470 [Labrenzia sp. THAF187b]QFT71180.1 hypothetical protein FIU93_30605 [Labrenzia sp. THAF35]QFT08290.1 hypothetical protein FIV05_31365 [Labrenzia sp. THAF191a]
MKRLRPPLTDAGEKWIVMSIQKECADRLRETYRNLTGSKLKSGHAHELVAAYFGYGTAAALQAEVEYPVEAIEAAAVLIPDLALMGRRQSELNQVPTDLQPVDDLAKEITAYLVDEGYFSGKVWHARDLSDEINSYVMEDPMLIEDALSGEIASTNAYFDELYIDEVVVDVTDDAFVATLTGSLNGEQDQDRVFHGDKINFTSTMTMYRIAARIAYQEPDFETGGSVDDSMYYEDDPA